jgi:hypothetical protein
MRKVDILRAAATATLAFLTFMDQADAILKAYREWAYDEDQSGEDK